VQQALLCNLLLAPAEDHQHQPPGQQACMPVADAITQAHQLCQLLGGLPGTVAQASLGW
jgi:hypothetical protein